MQATPRKYNKKSNVVETPPQTKTPKVEAPKVEKTPKIPKVEAPKTPKVEAPKTPKVEAPKVEKAPKIPKIPKVEKAPKTPKVEAPKVELPVGDSTVSTSSRRNLSEETVVQSFADLVTLINMEIATSTVAGTRTTTNKFLRVINKNIKLLEVHTLRVIKQNIRKPKKTVTKNNSGFLKPVGISADMAKFTGWNPEELHSRVEVTKYICNYIKENGLQDPQDRRMIKPDGKLQKLLGYESKSSDDPLRYYSLQTHLKQHFPK